MKDNKPNKLYALWIDDRILKPEDIHSSFYSRRRTSYLYHLESQAKAQINRIIKEFPELTWRVRIVEYAADIETEKE